MSEVQSGVRIPLQRSNKKMAELYQRAVAARPGS